jgi:hypothetical protein
MCLLTKEARLEILPGVHQVALVHPGVTQDLVPKVTPGVHLADQGLVHQDNRVDQTSVPREIRVDQEVAVERPALSVLPGEVRVATVALIRDKEEQY